MTPRQRDVLDYYRRTITHAGFTPTMEEAGKALGICAMSVKHHLDALERDGFLQQHRHRSRGVQLTGCPPLVGVSTAELRAELARRGELLDALDGGERKQFGRARSYGAGSGTCAAPGCQLQVQRGHLMCLSHWRVLPFELRERIISAHFAARKSRCPQDAALYGEAVTEARDLLDRRGEFG